MEMKYLISSEIFTTDFYLFHLNIKKYNKELLNFKMSGKAKQK
jgi:hypothetical protein